MNTFLFNPIVLYEDNDLVVINKPPGVVVNRAETVQEITIQDWWADYLKKNVVANDWNSLVPQNFSTEYGSPEEIFAERGGVVHRLDKETSGVLVLAKNPGMLVNLLQQFRLRQTQKTYICLVHGKFNILEDTLQLPLGRSVQNRTKFAVDTEGRVAETFYHVENFFQHINTEAEIFSKIKNAKKRMDRAYQGFSLVTCQPKTGRTHQIRVHMAHIKHPIVGDTTYLGKKRAALDVNWCPRLFLHAQKLVFMHPRSGKEMTVTAELWPDLQTALEYLKQ